jgi:hypothetical protein
MSRTKTHKPGILSWLMLTAAIGLNGAPGAGADAKPAVGIRGSRPL